MNESRVAVFGAALVLALAGCTGGATHGAVGTDSGYGSLVGSNYPTCGSQGQAVADYLNTGTPTSMDPDWGDERQQVLSMSGEQRALRIRQVADAYIQRCDEEQAQAAERASQQAAAAAAAAANAAAQASADAARQQAIATLSPVCAQVGGHLVDVRGGFACAQVPYFGGDGQRYYDELAISETSLVTDSSHAVDTSATPEQCAAGYYDTSSGAKYETPGHYAYGLCLAAWH